MSRYIHMYPFVARNHGGIPFSGVCFFILFFIFLRSSFLVRKSRLPGSNSRPNVSEGYEVPLSYRGDRLKLKIPTGGE